VPASASAKRYAAAAFNIAEQSGEYDAWLSSLNQLARIVQMPSARVVFLSPTVPASQKRAALDRMLPDALPLVRNFVHIVADRDRLDEMPGIVESLRDLINVRRGIVTADVTTAVPLDAEMQRLVAQRLAAYLNREPDKVTIRTRVDPTIIGGVIARVGDRLIDDSVRGRLDRLRQTLAGSAR